MKSSINARRIKEYFEGREYKAYKDPLSADGRPYTIGIGHTGPEVYLGLVWNDDQINSAYEKDVSEAERMVDSCVKVTINQYQYDALVSIMFNVGPGKKGVKDGIITLKSGDSSTLLRKLNSGDYAGCANEFTKWCRGGGKKSLGLYRRRFAEKLLFGGESAEVAINRAAKITEIPE